MQADNADRARAIAFSVMEGLAVILTLFRLGFRLKIQRFWWEDAWAAVASLCTVIFIVFTPDFVRTYDYEQILITGWINAHMFTSVVWSVRMSLIFSLLRITSSTLVRRMTLGVAACFFLFYATTFALETWWCVDNTKALSGQPPPNCVLPGFIVIFEVTTNCLADMTTLVCSVKLLWRVQLPRRQRRMILSLFSASRFLCMFSLAHSISQLVASESTQEIIANLQLLVFLVVCNLVVVVTYIYRTFLRSGDLELEDDDDFTTSRRSTRTFTTVDLELSCASLTEVENSFSSSPAPSIH